MSDSSGSSDSRDFYEEEEEARRDPDVQLVPLGDGCPGCGEYRMDYLALDEDEVTCATCGTVYRLR